MWTLLLLLPALAQEPADPYEQGFDAHGFVPAPIDGDLRDPLVVQRPGPWSAWDVFGTAMLEYADRPLVRLIQPSQGGDVKRDVVLDNLLALNLSAGIAPHERVRVAFGLPFYVMQRGLEGFQFAALGDLRSQVMVSILRPAYIRDTGGGLGVAAFGHVDAPLGTPERFLGQPGLAGGFGATATYELDRWTFSADLGTQFNPKVSLENLTNRDKLVSGLAISWLASERTGIGAEVRSFAAFGKAVDLPGSDSPAEAYLTVRHHLASGPWLVFGGSSAISRGAGAARFRLIASIGYGRVAPPREPDSDLIGALGAISDACPAALEVKNGWKDDDGCPDELGAVVAGASYGGERVVGADVTVTGPDGVTRFKVPEAGNGFSTKAIPGTAWNAAAVAADRCLAGEIAGTATEAGADLDVPMRIQRDAKVKLIVKGPGDVVLPEGRATWRSDVPTCAPEEAQWALPATGGSLDALAAIGHGHHTVVVDVAGYKPAERVVDVPQDGLATVEIVLEPALVVLQKTKIEILEKVFFEFAKAVIKPESFELLNQVADVINTHPDLGRVQVEGHTDDKGNDKYNLDLSQARAASVRQYLIGRGVPEDQLLAVGFGETKPIVENTTEEGRSQNRRVEFNLIDQQNDTPEEGIAPAGGTP